MYTTITCNDISINIGILFEFKSFERDTIHHVYVVEIVVIVYTIQNNRKENNEEEEEKEEAS